MKYKIGQKVKYFADDTEKYYMGVIKSINPIDQNYLVTFQGGSFWFNEEDLLEVK
tara:strand:- start:65 stop:229 length:165 start_codon:yes stop_codon:yes gene_type:complete